MLSLLARLGGRWCKTAVAVSFVFLLLGSVFLPPGRAEIRNAGARIQVHRNRDNPVVPATPARPPSPPSYFPDNDGGYPLGSRTTGSARALAPLFPWNQPGFVAYREPSLVPWDSADAAPDQYLLVATPLPQTQRVSSPAAATLVAHLPEHALFWVEDVRTRSRGLTRYLRSPLLQPGRGYTYTVRAAWIEDGHWVSQTRTVPVRAGRTQTIYLLPTPKNAAK